MSTAFWNSTKDAEKALARQITALQAELRDLRKIAGKRGAESYDHARDNAAEMMDELREGIVEVGGQIARQAQVAGNAARQNPAIAAGVGLVVIGLIASLVASRASRK